LDDDVEAPRFQSRIKKGEIDEKASYFSLTLSRRGPPLDRLLEYFTSALRTIVCIRTQMLPPTTCPSKVTQNEALA